MVYCVRGSNRFEVQAYSGMWGPAVPSSLILTTIESQLCLFGTMDLQDGSITQKKEHPLAQRQHSCKTFCSVSLSLQGCLGQGGQDLCPATLYKNREGNSGRKFQKHSLRTSGKQGREES